MERFDLDKIKCDVKVLLEGLREYEEAINSISSVIDRHSELMKNDARIMKYKEIYDMHRKYYKNDVTNCIEKIVSFWLDCISFMENPPIEFL